MTVFQLAGADWLRYEVSFINKMQLWRVFTGHLVHANWIHLVLNMVGFLFCVALTDVHWSFSQWLMRILFLAMGISACLYIFNPLFHWYVGFSGVLFGLYVMAAIDSWPRQKIISIVLLAIIIGKILLEQISSVTISSDYIIGVPVLVDAHLYGVVLALVVVSTQLYLAKRKQ